MFESATLTAAPASTRLWGAFAGVTGQALVLGCMLLAPLISPAVLPNLRSYVNLLDPPGPPPAPPPKGPTMVQPKFTKATHVLRCLFCEPLSVPTHVARIVDDEPLPAAATPGVIGGFETGSKDGVIGGVLTGIINSAPPPPPRAVAKEPDPVKPAAPPARVKAGGLVKLAAPIRRVEPVYPQMAKIGRIEGVVELEGIIGTDGRIHDLKVKSGHPFLVKAAVDAVLQWVYTPATLNGDLVEVIAPITVTFRLGSH